MNVKPLTNLFALLIFFISSSLSGSYVDELTKFETLPEELKSITTKDNAIEKVKALNKENQALRKTANPFFAIALNHYKIAVLNQKYRPKTKNLAYSPFSNCLTSFKKWSTSHKKHPLARWEYKFLNFVVRAHLILAQDKKLNNQTKDVLFSIFDDLFPKESAQKAKKIIQQAVQQLKMPVFHRAMFQTSPLDFTTLVKEGYLNYYLATYTTKEEAVQKVVKLTCAHWLLTTLLAKYKAYHLKGYQMQKLEQDPEMYFLLLMANLYRDQKKAFAKEMKRLGCNKKKVDEIHKALTSTSVAYTIHDLSGSLLHDMALFDAKLKESTTNVKINLQETNYYKNLNKIQNLSPSAQERLTQLYQAYAFAVQNSIPSAEELQEIDNDPKKIFSQTLQKIKQIKKGKKPIPQPKKKPKKEIINLADENRKNQSKHRGGNNLSRPQKSGRSFKVNTLQDSPSNNSSSIFGSILNPFGIQPKSSKKLKKKKDKKNKIQDNPSNIIPYHPPHSAPFPPAFPKKETNPITTREKWHAFFQENFYAIMIPTMLVLGALLFFMNDIFNALFRKRSKKPQPPSSPKKKKEKKKSLNSFKKRKKTNSHTLLKKKKIAIPST